MIKSKEYYEEFNKKFIQESMPKIEFHARYAAIYKKIYKSTKRRKGIFKWIKKLSYKLNGKHYKAGMDIIVEQCNLLLKNLQDLTEYIERKGN